MTSLAQLKAQILSLTRDYARQAHASFRPGDDPARTPWVPGTPIPYAGQCSRSMKLRLLSQAHWILAHPRF